MTDRVLLPVGQLLGQLPVAGAPLGLAAQVRRGPDLRALGLAESDAWATGRDDHDLCARGLLVQVPDDEAEAEQFARQHQFAPLLLGLGPSTVTPGMFGIGLPDWEIVTVTAELYELWARCAASPTLWSACETYARLCLSDGVDDPDQTRPGRVMLGVVANLPALLGAGAGYLDIVPPKVIQ